MKCVVLCLRARGMRQSSTIALELDYKERSVREDEDREGKEHTSGS